MENLKKYLKGDIIIWLVVLVLSMFSILAVYSSTGTLAFRYQGGNTEYYFIKHAGILIFGLFLMFLTHNIKYTFFSRLAQLLFYICIPLLLYTLIKGTNINEASRWITIPLVNLTFQSSDLAKLAVILYLARLLTKKQDEIKDFKNAFIPIILPVLLVTVLIFPANLSTAMLILLTSLVIMYVGRIRFKYLAAFSGISLAVLGLLIVILLQMPDGGRVGTWKTRIESYFSDDPDKNYQPDQSKIAITRGGFFGQLPGNSTQRNFLPHPYSDFIYAIIIEEYGLIGGIIILLMYLVLLFRGMRIAARSPGPFGAFLAIGLSFALVFQAFINMAVAVNLIPVTGQPLPLVSMGGTSIWFTSISIGIILSVSRDNKENEEGEINVG